MRRPKMTYANVMATIAVFVALGGTGYAASRLPRNSVGTEQVRNQSLQREDLAPGVAIQGARGPRGPEGGRGDPGAQGAQGPPGVASIITAVSKTVTQLGLAGGSSGDVVSIVVPQGKWWVTGSVSAVNDASGDQFRCSIIFGSAYGAAGSVARVGTDSMSAFAAGLTVQEGRTLNATTNVRLRCGHDSTLAGGNPRIDHGQITAVRADNLDIQ